MKTQCGDPSKLASNYVVRCIKEVALPPGALVLDAPTGFGRHAHWLAQMGHRVVGLDINEKRLLRAATDAPRTRYAIDWQVADLEKSLPTPTASFNLFIAVHYFSDQIINRAREALCVGGYFILETFGGHGQNWLSLPAIDEVPRSLADGFEIIDVEQRAVGPKESSAVVRTLAIRVSS